MNLERPEAHFIEAARRSVAEDLAHGDPTGSVVGPRAARAELVSRQSGVVSGLPGIEIILEEVAERLDSGPAEVSFALDDGDGVERGSVLGVIEGPADTMLAAERSLLNLVTHLSGVASLTARFVAAVAGTGAVVRDTRKTLPGLRHLEKYAVRCGGGVNHRLDLGEAALVKDNHVAAWGSLTAAIAAVRRSYPDLFLEVEVDTLEQVLEALDCGCQLLLLDNMDLASLSGAVEAARGRARTEASGGVTLSNVASVAATGVDYIAIGALTHSAPALDIGLDWSPLG